ncbi:MAG TPA: hypothetical protein VE863_11205, partial [Pyrinomonadaceae bacterium]|nr:hypothetical protein [Pyrinomonadaceae bacterium]
NRLEKQATRIPTKEVKHEEPKNARYLRYLALCSFGDCFRGRYKFTALCAWRNEFAALRERSDYGG